MLSLYQKKKGLKNSLRKENWNCKWMPNSRIAKLTVSVVDTDDTLWNLALEADDCLLSTESLKEDSLCDTNIQSLLGAWPRKCRQGTFSARVSLLKNNDLFTTFTLILNRRYYFVGWLLSPVFWVNDCVDERVVDSWCFGYNSGNSFGIGIEDASIPGGCKE